MGVECYARQGGNQPQTPVHPSRDELGSEGKCVAMWVRGSVRVQMCHKCAQSVCCMFGGEGCGGRGKKCVCASTIHPEG